VGADHDSHDEGSPSRIWSGTVATIDSVTVEPASAEHYAAWWLLLI
jgi:hypothetical protein